jgi:hypothetical protein
MNVTTADLLKNTYGTPCGSPPKNEKCLTFPLVIDFVDTFFGGVLNDVEVYKEDGIFFIEGGSPILKKKFITNEEFDKFTSISKRYRNEIIENLGDFFDISKAKFNDIQKNFDTDEQCDIICMLFSELVGNYGGSFRCDHMGNGEVDLESE